MTVPCAPIRIGPPNPPASARRTRLPGLAGLAGLVLAALAQAGGFAIDASVIAGGGGTSASAGGCLVVQASIGQDTVGSASVGALTLRSGFWPAVAGHATDSLFNSGFQECL